jgi:magnesium chelatase subunit D
MKRKRLFIYTFLLWGACASTAQAFTGGGAAPLVFHHTTIIRGDGIHRHPSTLLAAVETPVAQDLTRNDIVEDSNTIPVDWVHESFQADIVPQDVNVNFANMTKLNIEPRPFPFPLIVGMDEIKQALILAAVNPRRMGGVVISGRRGTAKSVLARAMQRLLPPTIRRIQNSPYNVDPLGVDGMDSILEMELQETNTTLQDLVTETVATPFVTVPLNAMEDSLLGTIDIERSMETGTTVFSPGLLARAHRGILYVDEVNLLEEEAANILLNVIADGYVHIEREGLSLQYPCKPLLIATYNPQEGELREHLLDRIGVALSSDLEPLSVEGRVQGVDNVLDFSSQHTTKLDMQKVQEEERRLQETIATARQLLPKVEISHSQILYLCEEATGAGCEGQRAEIFATEIAKASAAVSIKISKLGYYKTLSKVN